MLYMFLADGFEETEAIGCLDVLRRAGVRVKTVSVAGGAVCGCHDIMVLPDIDQKDIDYEQMEGIILPGGMPGTANLDFDKTVRKTIKYCMDNKLLMAAICAAPMVLGNAGALEGKKAVCYPGFEEFLMGAEYVDSPYVVSENVITAKGAGASMLFGAAIVDYFRPGDKGREILDKMQHA